MTERSVCRETEKDWAGLPTCKGNMSRLGLKQTNPHIFEAMDWLCEVTDGEARASENKAPLGSH